jgi:hypothetical protein
MPGWAPKLVISDWVSDDWGALMPEIHVNMADGRHLTSAPPQVYTEDYSNALKIVLVRLRIPEIMLTHDQWAYVYSDQDMVPVEMRTQFGDTNQPDVSLAATKIWLRSGEYLHLDYGKRKGMPLPELIDGKWEQVLMEQPLVLGRAQQIPHQGALLCLPEPTRLGAMMRRGLSGDGTDFAPRFNNLLARMDAPIFACAHWRDAKWLGLQNAPRAPLVDAQDNGWGEAQRRLQRFIGSLQLQGSLNDTRPHGLTKTPSQQGAVEDFGTTKGSMVATAGHPASIFEMQYDCEGWAMRYCHNKEAGGEIARAENHPDCKQWSHVPDPRQGTADLLGWPEDRPWGWYGPDLGWEPMDDQHYSINLKTALQQVSLSRATDADIEHILELDKMRVKGRIGAPRAVGRRLLAWANIAASGRPEQKEAAQFLADDLHVDVLTEGDLYRHLGEPEQTVRILTPRGAKYGWTRDGELIPGWVVWEHAFAVTGAYAWWLRTGDYKWRELAYHQARTILKHGVYERAGVWHHCYIVRSQFDGNGEHTGLPLDPALYRPDPNHDVFTYNSMWSWTVAAIQVFLELHEPRDAEMLRAERILEAIIGDRPGSWSMAEWTSITG